jgi:DNA-binding MarR family transcriptional regulator
MFGREGSLHRGPITGLRPKADMGKIVQENLDFLNPELEVLQNIYSQNDHVRQRDLARIAGLSLGMTNAIVKRLARKGWLTIRKVNNRNIRYAVSAAGIEQISRRSYHYFKRTIRNIVAYRELIENLVADIKQRGFDRLALLGRSDLDFIVEHACLARGIEYVRDEQSRSSAGDVGRTLFVLYAESYVPYGQERSYVANAAFLREVLSQAAAGDPPRGVDLSEQTT